MAQECYRNVSANTTSVITRTLLDDAQNGFTKGNYVCSQLSLDIVLGMLTVGAEGATLKQLLGFLRHGNGSIDQFLSQSPSSKLLAQSLSSQNSGLEFTLANSVWVRRGVNIESRYLRILEQFYKTQARFADFLDKVKLSEAVEEINSWIKKETKGLIQSVVKVSDFKENDFLVLANVLYFKGEWHKQFDARMTRNYDFGLINGDTVSVPYMTCHEPSFDYVSFPGFKMIKLPYKINHPSNSFSMYIFLPDRRDGLQDLLKLFHSNDAVFHGDFDLKRTTFRHFWIPKFKMSTTFEPEAVMKQMGLTLPFLETNREFSGIVQNAMIYVTKILQKSVIEVDEKGTVAASFTMIKCGFGGRSPDIDFVADHPFMFMIREDTSKGVLFVGVVLSPCLN